MKTKLYATLNFITIITVIFWNYYINTLGINGNTVGSLSDEYANLFTPAGYAFSIWGVIFIALLVHGLYQLNLAFRSTKSDKVIEVIGPWLILANLANCAWLWFWLNEMTGISVLIMLVILTALLTIVFRLGMQVVAEERHVQWYAWIPVSLYSGWITVATIANISAYLAKINWAQGMNETNWTIVMIFVAACVNLFVLFQRNMQVFAGVGVWALLAISVRHWGEIEVLQWTALMSALFVAAGILYHTFVAKKSVYHS